MEIQKVKNENFDDEQIDEIIETPPQVKKTKVKEKADGRTQNRTKKQLETLEKMRVAKQKKADARKKEFEDECKKIENSEEESEEEVKPKPKPKKKTKPKPPPPSSSEEESEDEYIPPPKPKKKTKAPVKKKPTKKKITYVESESSSSEEEFIITRQRKKKAPKAPPKQIEEQHYEDYEDPESDTNIMARTATKIQKVKKEPEQYQEPQYTNEEIKNAQLYRQMFGE
jgi:hypothetical protein